MEKQIDLNSPLVFPVLSILLQDKTTKRNIIWATDSYAEMGDFYLDRAEITVNALKVIDLQPRILKAQTEQQKRTRAHAEVFTPAWICNQMNNYLDVVWFGRKDVFSRQTGQNWEPTEGAIEFPEEKPWQNYVDSRRLEITCGEAPFIASRYDAATGEPIPLPRRVGLLDRKLRVVNENTRTKEDWLKWATRAVQSVYGYEWQGDNLVIARVNLLMTLLEYYDDRFGASPEGKAIRQIANIISWNFWQMDGLTGTVPLGKLGADPNAPKQLSMQDFMPVESAEAEEHETPPCRIFDWRTRESLTYNALKEESGRT